MDKDKISMVLSSCDNYEDAWEPFFCQFKKNWPTFDMPVYLCTETKTFKYDGFDIRCPLACGPVYRDWSKLLIKLLKKIDTEYIFFMLDDFWLTKPVDPDKFNKMVQYLISNPKIGFICLRHETHEYAPESEKQYAIDCEYPELLECLYGRSFRITTQAGIWRKDYLLKLLRGHESAWYFENRANWRSQFYKYRVFDVKETVLIYPVSGVFGGGKFFREYLSDFPESVIKKSVEKRGVIGFNEMRTYPKAKKGIAYLWSVIRSVWPKL